MRKNYFTPETCPVCGKRYDPIKQECPNCHESNPEEGSKRYAHQLPVPWWRQLVLFVTANLGLFILVSVIETILMADFTLQNPDLDVKQITEQFNDYISTGEGLFSIYVWVYPLVFIAVGLVLWSSWKDVGKSFKGWKPYVAAIVGFLAMLAFSYLYGLMIEGIFKAAGREVPGTNGNQSNVEAMVLYSPVGSLIIIGLIGPFTEECAYRVGVFGLSSRVRRWLGYLLGIVVFALVHIDFGSMTTAEGLISELIAIPQYLFPAACLCFLYDKFGFSASYTCHALNNIFSVLEIVIAARMNA